MLPQLCIVPNPSHYLDSKSNGIVSESGGIHEFRFDPDFTILSSEIELSYRGSGDLVARFRFRIRRVPNSKPDSADLHSLTVNENLAHRVLDVLPLVWYRN
ncbi:hypothetical protein AVEN_24803-1 [Araneus ventricosus]|uniref:Uncharacterized protein n=1 Tax=Araneus ventricosus TaxID=182803 RepID=A0A4Y2BTN4_ARAVE|nr:hypothetical protein AVEN_24803-1 [Araneus ventricosus]